MPGHPYALNIVRTVQPPTPNDPERASLILDIDVLTRHPLALDRTAAVTCLREMRWLKNKVFFGCFTEQALAPLR